jgi:hypothetical protein
MALDDDEMTPYKFTMVGRNAVFDSCVIGQARHGVEGCFILFFAASLVFAGIAVSIPFSCRAPIYPPSNPIQSRASRPIPCRHYDHYVIEYHSYSEDINTDVFAPPERCSTSLDDRVCIGQ